MNYSKYRFNLDMQSYISQVSLPVRQNDTGIVLRINLTDGGVPYTIRDGCRAVFYARKLDGNPLMNDCVIEKNTTICYELTQQTTSCSGVVDCELRLYGTDGNIITTPKFILVVDERVVHDEDFPLSEAEQNVLDNIILSETKRIANEEQREKTYQEMLDTVETASSVADTLEQKLATGDYDGKDGVDGKDGKDGLTPFIGSNGNWWIGTTDTGVLASNGFLPFTGGEGTNSLAQIGNTASEKNAVAFGAGTTASGINSFAKGKGTTASGGRSNAEGNGTTAEGTDSHAEGAGTKALGGQSHAEGSGTTASGDQSHAEGSGTTASKGKAHAEGYLTTASGQASHAEGKSNTAEGEASHTEGLGTYAKSTCSHAEGFETKALEGTAHAEGDATTAEGWSSHAEGYHTQATKGSAHAEGYFTKATGDYSHSEGSNTEASGSCSHAAGYFTKATGDYQTVVGKCNATNSSALFIVGKGTGSSNSSRSNALEVLNDGTVNYKGKYKVATGEVTAVLSSSYQVVTIVLDFEPNLIVVHGKDGASILASALWSNGRVCFANEGFRGDAPFANNKVAISFAYNMSGKYTYTAIGGVAGIDSSGGGTIPPSGGDTGGDSSGGSGGESGEIDLVEFSLDGETKYVEKGTLWGAWASGKEGYTIDYYGQIRVGEKYICDSNKKAVTSDKAIEKDNYQTLADLGITIDYTKFACLETRTLEEMFAGSTIVTSDFTLEENRFVDKLTGEPLLNTDGTVAKPTDVCAGKTYYCNNTPESSTTTFYVMNNTNYDWEGGEYTVDQKQCHNWYQFINNFETPFTIQDGRVYHTEAETYLSNTPDNTDNVRSTDTIRNGHSYVLEP